MPAVAQVRGARRSAGGAAGDVRPGVPVERWAKGAPGFSGWDELWERLWENSVDVPGPLVDRLIDAAGDRDPLRDRRKRARVGAPGEPSTTRCCLLGPDGLLHKHRKLMPTMQERIFHGIGGGDDLVGPETPLGRIGGLICWENRMPLARYAVYRGGPQIWVAPTADDSEGWLASMRHIAIESGAFVVSAPQYIPAAAFPTTSPSRCPRTRRCSETAVPRSSSRLGQVIAGPLYGEEGIVIADCDLRRARAKRWFDAVGHTAVRTSWRAWSPTPARDGPPVAPRTDAAESARSEH